MFEDRRTELDRTVFFLDVLLTIIVFIFSFYIRNHYVPKEEIDIYSHLFLIPLLLALLIGFLSYFGAYNSPHQTSILDYIWSILISSLLTVGVIFSLLYILKIQYISRFVIVVFAFTNFIILCAIRAIVVTYFHKSIQQGRSSLKILIIGTGIRARELAKELKKHAVWGLEIVGYLDPAGSQGQNIEGAPIVGTMENISECLKKYDIDEVIIAVPRSLLEDAEPIAQACEEEGIKLQFMADVFSVHVTRLSLTNVGNIPLLTMEPVALDNNKLFVKRIFDIVLTSISMPLVLPLMAVIALAIKVDSKGPAFFVQERVGLRKHLFPMIKFRSMYTDAEERLKEIEHLNEAEGPIFKIKNDPRVTRVGRILRKSSLDELPQLFNVLSGDMSLVGPRPMSIRDVNLFDKGIQRKRFSVKPGITCIWQVSGRSNLPFHKWLEMDLEYIDNWSLLLDVSLLFKTIPAVLKSKGAA